ncbi:CHAT domain-containing protein [Belliella sp. DSM 111904]|uniref:CHAT domain-containing protein n=1 Tax=Belliella filtrata TaxID=2923435 RepID=A0ABS9V1A7_9BACT|nr:CHAT domain-containing tetratricopeptide repeat protein [Belliella filtrata]MCH7409793.1 CHAT domain-containing protein [Belliella filtrata]
MNLILSVSNLEIQKLNSLENSYRDRVFFGTKSLPDSVLIPHYEYWVSNVTRTLNTQEESSLFLFLATCHLEKKNTWSQEIIALMKITKKPFFQNEDWRNSVVDYLEYLNQGSKLGKYDIDSLKNKLQVIKLTNSSNHEWIALATDRLGRTYYDHNQYDSAIFHLEKAGEMFQANGFKLYMVNNLTMQGVLWDAKEQFGKAASKYEASIEVLETLENPPLGTLGANAYNIGLIYDDRYGNSTKGIPYYLKALDYDSKGGIGNYGIVSEDYAALSRCYIKLGDLLKAEKYARLSAEYAKQIEESNGFEYAKALLVNAEVYLAKNQVNQGISNVTEGLEIFENIEKVNKLDLRRQRTLSNNLLGKIYLKAADLSNSKLHYLQAMNLAKEIKREIYLLESYSGLIQVAIEESDWDTAGRFWKAWGEIIHAKFYDAKYHVQLHQLKGMEIRLKSGASLEDVQFLKKVDEFINNSETMTMHQLHALNLKTIYLNKLSKRDYDAVTHLGIVVERLFDYLNYQHHVQNTALQHSELKLLIKNALDLGLILKVEGKEDLNLILFNLVSFNKSLGNIPKKNNATGVAKSSQLVKREAILSERYAEVLFMIYAHEAAQNTIKAINVLSLYEEEQKLEKELFDIRSQLLQSSERDYYAQFVSPLTSISQLHNRVEAEELWIETFVYDQDIYSAFISKTDFEIKHVALSKKQVEQWRNAYKSSTKKILSGSLPSWDSVFGKDLKMYTKIIYVPDSWLALMPIESFLINEDYMIRSKKIVYDVSLLDRLRRVDQESIEKQVFWMGFAPVYESRKLKYAAEEITKIGKLTQGISFIGDKVNKDLFKTESAKSSVFHLAAHGQIASLNPGYNALIFGDDLEDYLTVNEIYDWKIESDLGVLSACSSGVINENEGAGLLSLGRAFHFAGVQSLVISLWEIPDKQSAIIMELFYQNLLKGMNSSTSLREAKIQYLEQTDDDVFKHPYYWAGLVLIGEDNELESPKSYWWFILILILPFLYLGLRKFRE